ncbi:MAG: hypothetical protein ACI4DS_05040 [Eubacterium sp.]
MLGKLIKHEFKATSRWFLLMYAMFFIVTIIDKLFLMIDSDILIVNVCQTILSITYSIFIFCIYILTIILIIKRFYDNMLKEQGYLSFTLPVTTAQNVGAKLITSIIWLVATTMSMILSVVILVYKTEIFSDFIKAISEGISLIKTIGMYNTVCELMIKVIILLIISFIITPLMFYSCLAIGQLFNKHKILGAIGAYAVYYIINQVIGTVIIAITSITSIDATTIESFDIMGQLLNIYIVLYIVWGIVTACITTLILDKKLNLE